MIRDAIRDLVLLLHRRCIAYRDTETESTRSRESWRERDGGEGQENGSARLELQSGAELCVRAGGRALRRVFLIQSDRFSCVCGPACLCLRLLGRSQE